MRIRILQSESITADMHGDNRDEARNYPPRPFWSERTLEMVLSDLPGASRLP